MRVCVHPPEKNPYTIANIMAPTVLDAPNIAKMSAPVMTVTGQIMLKGPKTSADAFRISRPKVELALRIASCLFFSRQRMKGESRDGQCRRLML